METIGKLIDKITLFDEKKDIVHFFLGMLTGVGVVLFFTFDKILY